MCPHSHPVLPEEETTSPPETDPHFAPLAHRRLEILLQQHPELGVLLMQSVRFRDQLCPLVQNVAVRMGGERGRERVKRGDTTHQNGTQGLTGASDTEEGRPFRKSFLATQVYLDLLGLGAPDTPPHLLWSSAREAMGLRQGHEGRSESDLNKPLLVLPFKTGTGWLNIPPSHHWGSPWAQAFGQGAGLERNREAPGQHLRGMPCSVQPPPPSSFKSKRPRHLLVFLQAHDQGIPELHFSTRDDVGQSVPILGVLGVVPFFACFLHWGPLIPGEGAKREEDGWRLHPGSEAGHLPSTFDPPVQLDCQSSASSQCAL